MERMERWMDIEGGDGGVNGQQRDEWFVCVLYFEDQYI